MIVLDYPKEKILDGYVVSEVEINEGKYKVYRSDKKTKYYLIYAKNVETGKDNLYQYDANEGTIQIFNQDTSDLIDKYKNEKDNYKLYFIITLTVFLVSIIATIITILVKNKGKKKVKSKVQSNINF